MNYDQLMGFIAGLVIMFLLVAVIFTLNQAKKTLFENPLSNSGQTNVTFSLFGRKKVKQPMPVNIAKPDIMVVAQLYEDGTATINAKDYMGTPYPTSMQEYAIHRTLNALSSVLAPSTPESEIEAVREASTVLQGVEVDVEREEALNVIQPMLDGGDQFGNLVKGIKKGKA
jgi:hypothetical protein